MAALSSSRSGSGGTTSFPGAGCRRGRAADRARHLGAIGGLALSLSTIVSIALSMTANGLFGYTEPTLRPPVTLSIAAGAAAIVLLLAYLLAQRVSTPRRTDWSTA